MENIHFLLSWMKEEEETIALLKAANVDGFTPLHCFVSRKHHSSSYFYITLKRLLSEIHRYDPAILEQKTTNGQTPAHLLSTKNNEKTLSILLSPPFSSSSSPSPSFLPNVNLSDREKNTPLHNAVLSNNVRTVSVLLKAGADIWAKNNKDETPHSLANSKEIAEVLDKKRNKYEKNAFSPTNSIHFSSLKRKCCLNFTRSQDIELTVSCGEMLEVIVFISDWCLVQNTAQKKGLIPQFCVFDWISRDNPVRMTLDDLQKEKVDDWFSPPEGSKVTEPLQGCIDRMCHPGWMRFRSSFLLMFPLYFSPEVLLGWLTIKFCLLSLGGKDARASVVSVVLEWMKEYWAYDWANNEAMRDNFNILLHLCQAFGTKHKVALYHFYENSNSESWTNTSSKCACCDFSQASKKCLKCFRVICGACLQVKCCHMCERAFFCPIKWKNERKERDSEIAFHLQVPREANQEMMRITITDTMTVNDCLKTIENYLDKARVKFYIEMEEGKEEAKEEGREEEGLYPTRIHFENRREDGITSIHSRKSRKNQRKKAPFSPLKVSCPSSPRSPTIRARLPSPTPMASTSSRLPTSVSSPSPSSPSFHSPEIFCDAEEPLLPWLEQGGTLFIQDPQNQHYNRCVTIRSVSHIPKEQDSLLTQTAEEMADALNEFQRKMYSGIHPREILAWSQTKHKETECPSLFGFVTHFNTISAWTSTQIVRVLSLQERIKIVEKFLRVCQLSFEKGNFMGFYGVLSGIRHSSVSRMKKTMEGVEGGLKKRLGEFIDASSQFANFREYRSHLASFKGKSFIPFFGCTSKDLLFTMDGNPDHIQGSLNVLKICRVSEIIFDFKKGVIKSLPMIDQKSTTPREGGEKKRVEGWGLVHFQKMKDRDLEWWSRLGEPTDPNAKIRELVQTQVEMEQQMERMRKAYEQALQQQRDYFQAQYLEFVTLAESGQPLPPLSLPSPTSLSVPSDFPSGRLSALEESLQGKTEQDTRRKRIRRSCSLPQLLMPLKISMEGEEDEKGGVDDRVSWGDRGMRRVRISSPSGNFRIQEKKQKKLPDNFFTDNDDTTTQHDRDPSPTTTREYHKSPRSHSPLSHSHSPKPSRVPSSPLHANIPTSTDDFADLFAHKSKDDVLISVKLVPHLGDESISLNPEDYDLTFMIQSPQGKLISHDTILDHGKIEVFFMPKIIGTHTLQISSATQRVWSCQILITTPSSLSSSSPSRHGLLSSSVSYSNLLSMQNFSAKFIVPVGTEMGTNVIQFNSSSQDSKKLSVSFTVSLPSTSSNLSNSHPKTMSLPSPTWKSKMSKESVSPVNISQPSGRSRSGTTCFYVDAEGLMDDPKKEAITEIESKSEKKRNRFSVQTEPPRSPSPRPSDPSQAPVVPPPRPKRPGVVPQVLRVYLDDGDPFILKAGFPLSFSVRLDDKMKAPQLRQKMKQSLLRVSAQKNHAQFTKKFDQYCIVEVKRDGSERVVDSQQDLSIYESKVISPDTQIKFMMVIKFWNFKIEYPRSLTTKDSIIVNCLVYDPKSHKRVQNHEGELLLKVVEPKGGEVVEYIFQKERERDKDKEKYVFRAEVKGGKEGNYECMALFNNHPIQRKAAIVSVKPVKK